MTDGGATMQQKLPFLEKLVGQFLAMVKRRNQEAFMVVLREEQETEEDIKLNAEKMESHMEADLWEQQAMIHFTEGFAALKRSIEKART